MKNESKAEAILKRAATGELITPDEAKTLMNSHVTPMSDLTRVSNEITRRRFGNKIETCAIYPAKVGMCSGDCAFCAQSAYHKSNVKIINTNDLDENEILANAKHLYQLGVGRYSLVTSGEHLTDSEFDRIVEIFQRIKSEVDIPLCASLGSLTPERAAKLIESGVSRYHHNVETSRSYFAEICSTHSYDDKIETISIARQSGLEVCCGGIISMGETAAQRVEMAYEIRELDVTCIPINILNPIPGTRLEHQELLDADAILRTIAVFRLILQDKPLRFAGGRSAALGPDEYLGYNAGINATMVGNYLTTTGRTFEDEVSGLENAGLVI